ncbi:MAG: cytochrome b/b6 domain-containing protein [Hyphomicrobiales bacterium]|nr:cytochrome b/b6 domain-containing protein [Hyphomicrobiales bacterium]
MNEPEQHVEKSKIRVWDLPVRLFHWLLVVLVAVSIYTGLTGGLKGMDLHMVSGQAILCLVAFRVLWGFIGSRHARFVHFVRGPRAMLAYLRDSRAGRAWTPGHNPLGALSVLAMLALLAVQGTTGLFANDDIFLEGPLAAKVSKGTSDYLTFIHHLAADALFILIGLHLAAILGYLVVKRDNLVTPMVTGRKVPPAGAGAEDRPFASLRRALLVLVFVACVYWSLAAWL